jgi:dihydrofolate reductase
MSSPRKLILYIAASADGYIAKPGDDLSFLSLVAQEGEDYGYAAFIQGVDTVLLGRRTFDWIFKELGGQVPHPELKTYVITHTPRPPIGNTAFYADDLPVLVQRLKGEPGKAIFCDGGAALIDALLQEDLVDEMIVSLIPVLLGDGIRLFKDGRPEQLLEQVSAKAFPSGLVQLHYRRKRS